MPFLFTRISESSLWSKPFERLVMKAAGVQIVEGTIGELHESHNKSVQLGSGSFVTIFLQLGLLHSQKVIRNGKIGESGALLVLMHL